MFGGFVPFVSDTTFAPASDAVVSVRVPGGSLDRVLYEQRALTDTVWSGRLVDRSTYVLAVRESARQLEAKRVASIRAMGWTSTRTQQVIDRKIAIGMTAQMVRFSWGEPEHVNTTLTAAGRREQWVYADRSYVYLDNDRVTSIQTQR